MARLLLYLALGLWIGLPATASAQRDSISFAGKRVTIFIGYSPIGGIGYDTYGRVLARYLGKYLPGHPLVVPENRPGAGSMALANYLYKAAPKDGTEIGLVARGIAMDRLLYGAASTAQFDAAKFTWLGSMNNEVSGLYVSGTAAAKTLADVMAGHHLVVGAAGVGSDPWMFAVVLNSIFHLDLKIINGYPGMQEILLAMEKGEVDGVAGYSWAAARTTSAESLRTGKLKLLMQIALKKHKDLPDTPLVTELVKNADDEKVLELVFARQSMGRPFVAPPGLDPRLAAVLRQGFAEAMHDPDFIAECEKINMEINFVSGEEIQALVEKLNAFPAEVVARAQSIVAMK